MMHSILKLSEVSAGNLDAEKHRMVHQKISYYCTTKKTQHNQYAIMFMFFKVSKIHHVYFHLYLMGYELDRERFYESKLCIWNPNRWAVSLAG